MFLFDTTTSQTRKVTDQGEYKFWTCTNQCSQVGNKVIALVNLKPNVFSRRTIEPIPALISWTKSASAVTILDRFGK